MQTHCAGLFQKSAITVKGGFMEFAKEEKEEILGVKEIESLIPHRYPMRLIDEAQYSENMPNIMLATKTIYPNDILLQGHFPECPIFPGMLLLEMIAQTAALLIKKRFPEQAGLPIFTELDGSQKFLWPAYPGDTLLIQVELIKFKKDKLYIFFGHIKNQHDQTVCTSECLKGYPGKLLM